MKSFRSRQLWWTSWILWMAPLMIHADEFMNYDQHVRPIFREHCFGCHNSEKRTGGLSLETYALAMEGGSGGEVIYAGDLEGSRLWSLVNHEDEPKMPPNQDRLPAEKLLVIRQWIEQGALERGDSVVARQTMVLLEPARAIEEVSGVPGAMPQELPRQPVTFSAVPGAVLATAASPRAPLLAAGSPRQVCLYHLQSLELLGILPYPEGMPNVLRFSRDGNLLLVAGGRPGYHGNAVVIDVQTGKRRQTVGDELDSVLAADLDVSLRRIALGGPSKVVRTFATDSGELQYEIHKHTDWITALEFSPDGKFLASGDRQGMLIVWEADTGGEYQLLQGHAGAVSAVSWRHDSQVLATSGEDGTIKWWDVERPNPLRSWVAHQGGALDVQFGSNGQNVSAGRDKTVRLWDTGGKLSREFPPLADLALHAVLSHDGGTAVGADWSGSLKLWSAADGAELASLAINPPPLEMQLASTANALQAAQTDLAACQTRLSQHQGELETVASAFEASLAKLVAATKDQQATGPSRQPIAASADESRQEERLAELERSVGQSAARQKLLNDSTRGLEAAVREAHARVQTHQLQRDIAQRELDRFHEHLATLRQQVQDAEEQISSAELALQQAKNELSLYEAASTSSHVTE